MSSRAVFLDRDGTLIEHFEYLTRPSDVRLLPSAAGALRRLKAGGFSLVVVTNQSAVARGFLTEEGLAEIHDRMRRLMAGEGASVDRIYYCPYHPEAAVERYRRDSDLRKPGAGMLLLAARELGIDVSRSWMVGDDDRDVEAGKAAGCRTIRLEGPLHPRAGARGPKPDLVASDLGEAADLVLRDAERDARRG